MSIEGKGELSPKDQLQGRVDKLTVSETYQMLRFEQTKRNFFYTHPTEKQILAVSELIRVSDAVEHVVYDRHWIEGLRDTGRSEEEILQGLHGRENRVAQARRDHQKSDISEEPTGERTEPSLEALVAPGSPVDEAIARLQEADTLEQTKFDEANSALNEFLDRQPETNREELAKIINFAMEYTKQVEETKMMGALLEDPEISLKKAITIVDRKNEL